MKASIFDRKTVKSPALGGVASAALLIVSGACWTFFATLVTWRQGQLWK